MIHKGTIKVAKKTNLSRFGLRAEDTDRVFGQFVKELYILSRMRSERSVCTFIPHLQSRRAKKIGVMIAPHLREVLNASSMAILQILATMCTLQVAWALYHIRPFLHSILLHSRRVVTVHGAVATPTELTIIMEFVERGCLRAVSVLLLAKRVSAIAPTLLGVPTNISSSHQS